MVFKMGEYTPARDIAQAAHDDAHGTPPSKRPVAWRVRDCADGWIIYQGPGGEEAAYKEAESRGALMQGLYVRDGT